MATPAQEIDLDQVTFAGPDLLLLGQVRLAAGPGRLVAGANQFDDGDDPEIAVSVQDRDVMLADLELLDLHDERRRDRRPTLARWCSTS